MTNVIILAGYKGSGKSLASEIMESNFGANIFKLGGFIDDFLVTNGISINPENKAKYSKILLEKSQNNSLIDYVQIQIQRNDTLAIIDSAASIQDVKTSRMYFPESKLIYIKTTPEFRHTNIIRRNRSDDYKTIENITECEKELIQTMNKLESLSDFIIINDGDLETFKNNVIKSYKYVNNRNKNPS